jgi:hypothetical protein
MPSDAKKLSDWLKGQPGLLHQALSHAEQLTRATGALRAFLNEPWSHAARVASFDGDTAVIYADHAAAATLLRFRAESLLAFVRERYNPSCTSVEIKVQPEAYTPK